MSLPQRARSQPRIKARPAGGSDHKQQATALVEGPIGTTLLVFSLPILASSVPQSINASINAAWIGNILGARALTASANANSLLFFLLSLCFGLGMAASILLAQSLGARNLGDAKRIVGTAFGFFAAISLAMAAIGVIAAPKCCWQCVRPRMRLRSPPPTCGLSLSPCRACISTRS